MTKAERLKALQARLAKLKLRQAQVAQPPAVASAIPVTSMLEKLLPPIRIELAVKAQTDPNSEQRVVDRVSPSPG